MFAQSKALLAHHELSRGTEWTLTVVSSVLILLTSIWAYRKYAAYKGEASPEAGFGKVLQNKWYVDELYNAIIVNPLKSFSGFLNRVVERSGIDGLVNGVGRGVNYTSRQIRLLQNGQAGTYILMMVLGIIILFIVQIFSR